MSLQSRMTDIGIGTCCCCCSCASSAGLIITSSTNHLCNGLGVARFSDIVVGNCGDTGILIQTSQLASTNALGRARFGDSFVGCFSGIIIQGSMNTLVGG